MCLSEKDSIAYKPFHNQLSKPGFDKFLTELVKYAMVQFTRDNVIRLPQKLACFDDVLLQDGSSFRVHDSLADIFPSRFKKTPAAIECHVTMSLKSLSPKAMTVTADTASERTYLPEVGHMTNKLLLADAGYIDFQYFSQLHTQGGRFIVRGGKSLNPTLTEA